MASGQIVIITARWMLVLAGLLLTLWQPGTVAELRVHIVALLLLAVGNFYLHAQVVMRLITLAAMGGLGTFYWRIPAAALLRRAQGRAGGGVARMQNAECRMQNAEATPSSSAFRLRPRIVRLRSTGVHRWAFSVAQ